VLVGTGSPAGKDVQATSVVRHTVKGRDQSIDIRATIGGQDTRAQGWLYAMVKTQDGPKRLLWAITVCREADWCPDQLEPVHWVAGIPTRHKGLPRVGVGMNFESVVGWTPITFIKGTSSRG
jgi:hypothetical protein